MMRTEDDSHDMEFLSVFHMPLSSFAVEQGAGMRSFYSRRERAIPIRDAIEAHLADGQLVEIDCAGVEATQSFMDELVGVIVLERGPRILPKLRFKKCSDDMKAIIKFVVADRVAQHEKDPHFFAPR